MLLDLETRARQRRLILRMEAKFCTFWPPVKIRGRFAKFFRVTFWRHLGPNHWYTFDGAPLRRLVAISVHGKKSSEVKYKGLFDYCRSGLKKGEVFSETQCRLYVHQSDQHCQSRNAGLGWWQHALICAKATKGTQPWQVTKFSSTQKWVCIPITIIQQATKFKLQRCRGCASDNDFMNDKWHTYCKYWGMCK